MCKVCSKYLSISLKALYNNQQIENLFKTNSSFTIAANTFDYGITLEGYWEGKKEVSKIVYGLSLKKSLELAGLQGEDYILYKAYDKDTVQLINVMTSKVVDSFDRVDFNVNENETCYSVYNGVKFKFVKK